MYKNKYNNKYIKTNTMVIWETEKKELQKKKVVKNN